MHSDLTGPRICVHTCLRLFLFTMALGYFCHQAAGQTSYPLYCQGPLTTSAPTPPPTGPTTTPFTWASTGAGAQAPGAGECAWADRAAGGAELVNGNGNVICDAVGFVYSLPAGQYWEIGVYRDETANNCMRVTQSVGTVNPPFSATPALPPTQTPPSYPLYCQGPLQTGAPLPSGQTLTPYTWSATGAGTQSPGAGQCAWADRAPGGLELQNGNGNVICDWSVLMNGVPAGQYYEIGVYRDQLHNNCMHVTRIIGIVSPPFSSIPALPPYVRPSVATLTPPQLASLERGIQVMMNRNPVDATSYRFQANIHGESYDTITTPRQSSAWNQCEHGSYYFFSWHRMYLYFFERILRAASGDPNLALPYWNWNDPNQRALPNAFWQPQTGNPLFIPVSYTEPNGTVLQGRQPGVDAGTAFLSDGTVDFSGAFADTNFDSPTGSGLSFGGQIASPTQFNSPHGELESQPHDVVHVALGGLMGDPETAAEDPIFWLHHANIDRLWNRWIAQGGGRQDPTGDAAWMNTTFTFYDENGTAIKMSGQQIIDTVNQLGYRYDDDPVPAPRPRRRSVALLRAVQVRRTPLTPPQAPNEPANRVLLNEQAAQTSVPLSSNATEILNSRLKSKTSHRVVLQITDIQYERSPDVYYEIFLDLPSGGPQSPKSPYFVGNLSFFALKPHGSMSSPTEPGAGGKRDFDVTKAVSTLIEEHQWNPARISLTFVPKGLVDRQGQPLPIPPGKKASLGQITLSIE